MKMRELEARTGLNRETIRVYLRRGLVPEPERPKANVADYDERHVRAIVAIRDLQRDNGLTLGQIDSVLNGRHGERRVEAGAFHHLEALVTTRVGLDARPILISSLLEAWPQALHDARVLQSVGIVTILKTRSGAALSVTDTRLVTIWGEMRAAGFTEALGFTPDILAFYVNPATTVAASEAELFLERTEGKIDETTAAAMLQVALRVMLDFFGLLRMKAFLRRIHRNLPVPGSTRRSSRTRRTSRVPGKQ